MIAAQKEIESLAALFGARLQASRLEVTNPNAFSSASVSAIVGLSTIDLLVARL